MPRIDSNEVEIRRGRPRKMDSTGDASESLEPALIEPADRVIANDWARSMAFNEELVTVMVHESTEKNAEPIVEVFNNGIAQRFVRGQEQVVKRKFVEVLAKSKITTYSQEKYRDNDGNESYRQIPHTAVRYPFSMVEDANPRGRDWLKSILQAQH